MEAPNNASTTALVSGVPAPAGPPPLAAAARVNPAILDAAARYYGRVIADQGLPALAQTAPMLGDILARAGAGDA